MAEKIKLNKNSLRDQKQALALFEEFLPTLELRKQQLQTELRIAKRRIKKKRKALAEHLAGAGRWAGLLDAFFGQVRPFVRIREVETKRGNVAGVKVPIFEKVVFEPFDYSLVATEPHFDDAVAFWQQAVSMREEIKILEEQMRLLDIELTKTTQRINLYEKVLIPETKENIRKIKVYLGDQQTAAVCRAKIAKEKIVRKSLALAAALAAGKA